MSQYPTNLFGTICETAPPLELNVSGSGWDGGERRVFEHPFVLIGRDEQCCLCLNDATVSRRHAYLQQLGERVFCVDLGSRTGTRWEGEPRPAGWFLPDRGIQVGPFTLALADTVRGGGAPQAESAEAGDPLQDRINDERHLPRFHITVDNEVRSLFRMNRVLALVGSSPACRVRLRHAGISPYHCSLVRTPEGVWVLDLLSGTGTRLNGQPIRWARVNEGDQLRVGPYLLRLGYEEESTTTGSIVLPETRTDSAPPLQAELEQLRARLQDTELLKRQLVDREAECNQFRSQAQVLEIRVAEANDLQARLEAAEAGTRQLEDERLRDTEILRQQLADRATECHRLVEQARTLEIQLAELADLKVRLEAAEAEARNLKEVCGERDRWQAETQTLHTRIASELVEREELRQRLEAAQQQLVEEREAVRGANVRLDQQSAALQESQADLAARTAEHDRLTQQLRETREELARTQGTAHDHHAELNEAKERQKDAEALRQQLADAGTKHDQLFVRILELEGRATSADRLQDRLRDAEAETEQLREQLQAAQSGLDESNGLRSECVRLQEQARALEIESAELADLKTRLEAAQADARRLEDIRLRDMELLKQQLAEREAECIQFREQSRVLEIQAAELAELKTRLEAAQTDAGKLEDVCTERDHWQAETQTLRNRIASELVEREQLDRLSADLHAVQVERDRLLAEQQTSLHRAEEAWARVSDLERALTDATASHETTVTEERARWESERQALKTLIEQAGETRQRSAQTAIREVQARSAAEREEWRQRLDGAEAQIVWERGLFQEQSEQLRQQVAALRAERDRLAARLAQAASFLPTAEERTQDRSSRPAETNPLRQLAMKDQALVQFCGIEIGHPLNPSARAQGTNKPAEQSRPRGHHPSDWTQGGDQLRLSSIEQGVEAAWTQAAAGWERPEHANKQEPEVDPDAAAKNTGENQSVQTMPLAALADNGHAANPSDTAQREPTISEGEQPGEVFDDWRSQKKEEQQGLWRQILNFVRGK